MGGKGRGEIRDEAVEVTGVASDMSTTDSLRKMYGTFGGWGNVSWESSEFINKFAK